MNIEIKGFVGQQCIKKENFNQFLKNTNPVTKLKGLIKLNLVTVENETNDIQYNQVLKKKYQEQINLIQNVVKKMPEELQFKNNLLLEEYEKQLERCFESVVEDENDRQIPQESQQQDKNEQYIQDLIKRYNCQRNVASYYLQAAQGNYEQACNFMSQN